MKRAEGIITYVAFGLMALFVTLGSLFIAGYAFEDPGGLAAVGLVALWLVPLLVLTGVAFRWPSAAVWVLAGALVLVGGAWLWYCLDTTAWHELMDESGPVLGISTFVLGLPLAVLGLRRQLAAGLMLLAAAVLPYIAFLTTIRDEPWRGLGDSLTTSSTIACGPAFIIGLLFLLAALFGRLGKPAPPVPPPAAPQPPVRQDVLGGGSRV